MVDAVSILALQAQASRSAPRVESVSASAAPAQRDFAGFVSSTIRVDNLQNVAILEYRSEKGEVIQQYPTQAQIDAFKTAERLSTKQTTAAPHTTTAPAAPAAPAAPTDGGSPSGAESGSHSVLA